VHQGLSSTNKSLQVRVQVLVLLLVSVPIVAGSELHLLPVRKNTGYMMRAIDIQRRTQAQPPMTELDDLVSKDMNKLSMEERENALNDVHGIVDTNRLEDEPPELVDRRLRDLVRELDPIKRGTAYETAERISQNYVGDRRFRLAFLRAESFDAKHAAHRMIRYFEEKKSLFGEEKLIKDISLDDLDEEDMNTLEAGYLQVLPVKDRSDRRIIAVLRRLREYRYAENAVRVSFFPNDCFQLPPLLIYVCSNLLY
jgi:hypothetical protein